MRFSLLALFTLLTACSEKPVEKPKESSPRLPKITHFYGNAASVPKGESLTLCYGTENIDSVTITPSDDKDLRPALNRCIAHRPTKDTTYVMTAKGPGGETTASFSVRIGAAAPSGKERVLIQSFLSLGAGPFNAGARVQLCYTTDGATAVSVQPAAPAKLAPGTNQCFVVSPDKTTTYVLSATAADGASDRMQVTVPIH
jgi:hypothetical protein